MKTIIRGAFAYHLEISPFIIMIQIIKQLV